MPATPSPNVSTCLWFMETRLKRAFSAMMAMLKLNFAALQRAYDGQ